MGFGKFDARGKKILCITPSLKHPKNCMRGNVGFSRFFLGTI
jgi:hypothetical protein